MRLLAPVVLIAALACGGGRDPGPAVDAERGPPSGPRLGDPAGPVLSQPSSHRDSFGDVVALGEASDLGIKMTTTASVADGVVVSSRWSASTPGPDGSDLCWWVQEQLDTRYGASQVGGLPGVFPERVWLGEEVAVTWRRTGELGTTDYTCEVRWTLRRVQTE